MGKGSTPRPIDIPTKQYEDNWERTFGKKQQPKKEEKK
ncbi:hypothetical protein UFOVP180_35 [uncultured Caudovirales phage]|uniref:Uncharacterized protein n=1 Tax=uncultured Caudovirales phage TaxID=2100421 RepID=A0A6J7WFZ8_9CAUD|nr:hypothetical protein UFOVP180_35 [uncultured Caudovirales phage]